MTEKLEITEKRFDEINEKLTDINVINDQEQYNSYGRRNKAVRYRLCFPVRQQG